MRHRQRDRDGNTHRERERERERGHTGGALPGQILAIWRVTRRDTETER